MSTATISVLHDQLVSIANEGQFDEFDIRQNRRWLTRGAATISSGLILELALRIENLSGRREYFALLARELAKGPIEDASALKMDTVGQSAAFRIEFSTAAYEVLKFTSS